MWDWTFKACDGRQIKHLWYAKMRSRKTTSLTHCEEKNVPTLVGEQQFVLCEINVQWYYATRLSFA